LHPLPVASSLWNPCQIKSRGLLVGQLVNCDTFALLYLLVLFASFDRVRLNSLWGPMIVRKNARLTSIHRRATSVNTCVSTFARSRRFEMPRAVLTTQRRPYLVADLETCIHLLGELGTQSIRQSSAGCGFGCFKYLTTGLGDRTCRKGVRRIQL
jgi:hypothetical protein